MDEKHAEQLLAAMQQARQREIDADKNYKHALAQAEDTGYSADGATGLRIAATEYHRALEDYSSALKAWSDYVFQTEPRSPKE